MNSKQMYFLLLACLTLVGLLALSSIGLGNVLLQKETSHLVDLKLENKVLDEQQVALVQANKDVTKYADLEKIAQAIVPKDKDQARVVREITNLAVATGVPIQYIGFPNSSLGQAAPTVVKSSNDKTTDQPKVVTTPSQLKTVPGLDGLYQLEISVQSDSTKPITFAQLIDFLNKLENNRRTAQVTTINVTPDNKNRKLVTFSLVVNVYIKP